MAHCNFCAYTGKYQSNVNQHALHKHFYCIPCEKECESLDSIIDHQKDVHGRNFTCNICSKRFLELARLTQHMDTIHAEKTKEKIHCCEFCEFKTDMILKLDEHMKAVHHVNKDIQCPKCDFKTAWQRSLDLHIKVKHEKDTLPKLTCSQCDFVTHSKPSFRSHQKLHQVKDNIECEHCGTRFTRKDSYKHHLKIVHGNSKTFKCDECDFVSKYPQAVKAHRLWKHTENNKQFQCDLCKKGYVTKKSLKYHIETAHLQTKKYKCEVCEFECFYKRNFKRHMDEHLPDDEKLKCDYCSYVTPNKNVLDRHIELSHKNRPEGTNNWRNCVLCEYVAESGYDYKLHIANNHRGKLKCEFCDFETHERKCMGEHRENCGPNVKLFHCYKCNDFKTSTVYTLARHLNTVHGKNTKCDKCEFTTEKTVNMRRHEKRCYNLQAKAKCDFCDYTSVNTGNVEKHMKTCKANSKMYQCTKCEFKASSDLAVTRHISKKHGQYTKCSFCVYQASDWSEMRRHEKKCRGDESIFTCQKCQLQMNFWHYRRHHKTCDGRKITKENKKITCKTCGTHFSSALMLRAHQNLEHEETKRPGKWVVKLSKLNL